STNKVIATRIGANHRNARQRQIAIDFAGPKLAALPEGVVPEAVASCSPNGVITEAQVFPLPAGGVWRAVLVMEPGPGNHDPVDIRCTLKRGEEVLTETWTYHWSPP